MKVHELKTWPEYFWPLARGELTGCVRNDDRGFAVGDVVHLREWSKAEGYSGGTLIRRITYVLRDLEGIQPGYAGLSFAEVET